MSSPGADTETRSTPPEPDQVQRQASTRTWASGGLLRSYRGRNLRPAEEAVFAHNAGQLRGRVLELGCGGGRITGHLIGLGATVHGTDIAPKMVAYCERTYPPATFGVADLRDASGWGAGPWDVIIAGWALIDVLSDEERARFFDDAHGLLAPGGLLIFSSHNLACAHLVRGPLRSISADNPVSLASQLLRLPRSLLNHRRLTPWQRFEPDYAILNGAAHDFSLLHYYITRDGQERQLSAHGFQLLECLDVEAAAVAAGEDAVGSHELHYAALRTERRQADR
ncbi:MAG TPA: class I SAM-dependent methyltransferase [Solirubrobacteraceae bacterium]|jgi:2-polyprenyl-3-methyl-5-hydroxy-6-metoxy-1,4-benzoquinol methylase